jgi:hypothetical protein
MTMSDWLLAASVYWSQHTAQRQGQAYFNSLEEHRPDIAFAIRTSLADPFYDNTRISAFLDKVRELW